MRRLPLMLIVTALTGLLTATATLAAHTVTVWPGAMDGWATRLTDDGTPPVTATATFELGPAMPPLGTGSLELAVGANGAGAAELRNGDYAGTRLDELAALSYSTFVETDGTGGQAPYLILSIDTDGDSAGDDLLFFEPNYQDGTYAGDPVPDQGDLAVGAWQTWDALVGGWWSLNAGTFGPPLTTLANYVTANPDATIVNETAGGGIRVVAGFGAGTWDGFVGNVDAIVIGNAAHTTTFDLELAPAAVSTPTPTPTVAPTATPTPAADDGGDVLLPDTGVPGAGSAAPLVIAIMGGLGALIIGRLRRRG